MKGAGGMITHIMKDGTVLKDISGVTVPQDIVKTIVGIALDVRKEKKNGCKQENSTRINAEPLEAR